MKTLEEQARELGSALAVEFQSPYYGSADATAAILAALRAARDQGLQETEELEPFPDLGDDELRGWDMRTRAIARLRAGGAS